ncbi:MAG TPA: hypothetical protein P5121_06130 [Caldilineaceae bacterium]|nr:hypothetical protein [Caldilineaceae bacterium]
MKIRRIELVALLAIMLVLNVLISTWWLSGSTFRTAWASRLTDTATLETTAAATIPSSFSYQGTLRDGTGALVTGPITLDLKLYTVPTGGPVKHAESFNVNVRDGAFSLVVGDAGTPVDPAIFNSAQVYIGIAINGEAEMLPRQRLHPVPWAMQASTAISAVSADALAPNANVSSVAGPVTVNGNLTTNGNSTVTGNLTVNNDLAVAGALALGDDVTTLAVHTVGDSTTTPVTTSYPVSVNRYVVEAIRHGTTPDSIPLDDAILSSLCQDVDGCMITLGMRNWSNGFGPLSDTAQFASVGPYRFSIGPTQANKRNWTIRDTSGGTIAGSVRDAVDGAATGYNTALLAYDTCVFSDGEMTDGTWVGDLGLGFSLTTLGTTYTNTQLRCILIIED